MSGMALIWAANVKGLKLAAKIVLIQLADFHNKETGQCNPIAKGLADECEMGRATLFRHMTTLDECGLVTRHARGDGDGGRGCPRPPGYHRGPRRRPKSSNFRDCFLIIGTALRYLAALYKTRTVFF